MTERPWSELVGAYVLGALDPGEREAFEEELKRDEALRTRVANLHDVTGALGLTVPQRTPPPGLRERVLDRAREERAQPLAKGPDRPDIGPEPRRVRTALPWLAAAASLAAALAVGVGNARLQDEADALRQARQDLADELELARADAARQDSILATFAGPDVRTATLSTTGQEPSVRLFLDPARAVVVVAAFDLEPAPAGRTYQLWGIVGGQDPISLGTFDTGPAGTTLLALGVPPDVPFEVSAVTEEPAGGSPQPTTQPFLVGTWGAVD